MSLRQLGDVGRNAPRFVLGWAFRDGAAAGLVVKVEVTKRDAGRVADDEKIPGVRGLTRAAGIGAPSQNDSPESSLAILAAIRRASSRVSKFAAALENLLLLALGGTNVAPRIGGRLLVRYLVDGRFIGFVGSLLSSVCS